MTTYVSAAAYEPFGPQKSLSFGNGTTQTMSFDNRYRVTQNKLVKDSPLTTLAEYNYMEDGLGNISRIDDAQDVGFNRVFAYDDLNRLTVADSGASLWGTGSYGYDAMGNITSLALGSSRTATFTYSGTLPKLTSVTETGPGTRTVTYDAAGNETGVGAGTFSYSSRNYLSSGEAIEYVYDGRGLRTVSSGEFAIPLSLTSITLDPTSVVGGNPSTGTATLTGPAPMGGTVVTLSSSNTAVATVPESVTVLEGMTSATFTVTTFTVATSTNVDITGVFVTTRTATLTVNPAGGVTLTVSPTSVPAGGTVTATWSGIPSPTTLDWVGLYEPLAPDTSFLAFQYTDGSASGSMPFTIPSTTVPGTYELRLFSNDTFNRLATSNSFTVTAGMGGLLGGEGSVLIAGGRPFGEPVGRLASLSWDSLVLAPSAHRLAVSESYWGEAVCQDLGLGGLEFDVSLLPTLKPLSVSVVSKRYFFYTPEMNLLAESELTSGTAPAILYEYIWFAGHPVAQMESGTTTSWTFTDHLGTPLIQTNSTDSISWRVEYEPYGRVFALRTANQHQPLRLPGQESEEFNVSLDGNGATERFYNVFRHYRYAWGRYTQFDRAWSPRRFYDINPYLYAAANPITYVDRYGLVTWKCSYNLTTGNQPIFGTGGGVFFAHCTSECACGTSVTTELLGSVVGISAGPLPFGTSSSNITLKDPFACPAAGSLAGKVTLGSVGGAVGVGGSCSDLNLGSATGRSCGFTVGLDIGLDWYFGAAATVYDSRSPCCPKP